MEDLQNLDIDELATQVGGRFKLCTMVIKRARMRLLTQDAASGKLNSQVLKEVFTEIKEGRLTLTEPDDTLALKDE
tara:strand:+ start:350 stop:577 length:228 start_codon:yes stop_codon:yes gene_type:complete